MLRLTRLFICLAFAWSSPIQAQNYDADAQRITDSLMADSAYSARIPADDRYAYMRIEDSVLKALVYAVIETAAKAEKFTWPSAYLRELRYVPDPDTAIDTYPSETAEVLLEQKYHVAVWSLGCVTSRSEILHDSLMMVAIRRRYGQDFFTAAIREADSLDAAGMGLRLPYIKRPDSTIAILSRTLPEVKAYADGGNRRALEITFYHHKPSNAMMVSRSFATFSDNDFMIRHPNLFEVLKALPWTPPTFAGQPVDHPVYWDIQRNELLWY